MRGRSNALARLVVLMLGTCALPASATGVDSTWLQLRQRQFVAWQATPTGKSEQIWDEPDAPQLTILPVGAFMMGSPESESGSNEDERPLHQVHIGYRLAVSSHLVTVGEFMAFVAASGYRTDQRCESYDRSPGRQPRRSWREPGFAQTADNPVVCISWFDAQSYVAWLSRQTRRRYRLLSEAEYEYAARAGTASAWWWGNEAGSNHANCDGCGSIWGHLSTSPSGSFAPNAFGLFDMAGNAWSWTADCWNPNYDSVSDDGSPVTTGDCSARVLRGGSWFFNPRQMRSATRYWITRQYRFNDVGFRVATLP